MVKGGADNRKHRQQRRGKRKRVFTGNSKPKLSKLDLQDENQTYPDENVNVPSDVTGSSTAVSNAKPAEDNVATNASFLDEESDWVDVVEEEIETVSKKKMKNIDIEEVEESRLLGYRLFHLSILNTVFGNMICPECKTPNLCLQETLKQGLAFKYTITCHNVGSCRWCYSFFNSPRTKKNTTKFSRSFDVNPRTVYSMRRLGQGYTSLNFFLYLMNHPPPMSERSYRQINVKICDSVQIVADNSLLAAAEEVKVMEGLLDDGYCHTSVSFDGTWQRRGFSSLNGAVAAISMVNGKVLDVAAMTRHCQGCVNINALKSNVSENEFMKYKAEHNCSITHLGSAPAMETKGTVEIFNRSKDKGLIYTGDSKGYEKVKETYPGVSVVKYECIGHVQKRVGNRLRKLKKKVKGLSGLTDSVIDKLQNYYGMAIRSNVNDLESMKSAVAAVLFHVASTDATMDIIKHVKPIFQDLQNDSLLSKCLHGKTQNQNESFNSIIWKRVPKDVFIGGKTFRMGVMDSVSHFNDGNIATLNTYDEIGLEYGHYTTIGCQKGNIERANNSVRKSGEGYRS